MLPAAQWLAVVRDAPLVSIDLILRDRQQRVLLGWRNNEPARNSWFVPGGVIRKSETLDAAFSRIAQGELGLPLARSQADLLGIYEHHYACNFAGIDGVATHYVVLAHQAAIDDAALHADAQHRELRWFSVAALLADPSVHDNTKAYFVEAS